LAYPAGLFYFNIILIELIITIAILFIDISGFTPLNEKMAQLGRAGPELVGLFS
jgi:hypothetical protein